MGGEEEVRKAKAKDWVSRIILHGFVWSLTLLRWLCKVWLFQTNAESVRAFRFDNIARCCLSLEACSASQDKIGPIILTL